MTVGRSEQAHPNTATMLVGTAQPAIPATRFSRGGLAPCLEIIHLGYHEHCKGNPNRNRQAHKLVPIEYKGFMREEPLRFDILVDPFSRADSRPVLDLVSHKSALLRAGLECGHAFRPVCAVPKIDTRGGLDHPPASERSRSDRVED